MNHFLATAASPYLQAHRNDPVRWRVWGSATFEEARETGRPVFLSIGYYSGHLCHVMQRESFEDREIARVLNEAFIPVLVDREERPDINSVYLRAAQQLTGVAGWPLTVFTDSGGRPFFAGSYFPRGDFGERTGLCGLLHALREKWSSSRAELLRTAGELAGFLSPAKAGDDASVSDPETFLRAAADQLSDSFDEEYGGFGKGKKYPAVQNLLFLMRYSRLSGDRRAREIADRTLQRMYRGGIFDHFGGGFFACSADREWLTPRFEKTLSGNALLALTYTEAWQEGRFALYRTVAESCLDWCLAELCTPSGLYYNSQDADSAGREGGYYLVTPGDVADVLGEEAGRHFCECYDITDAGNFRGRNIPNLLLNERWNLLPAGYDDYRERLRLRRESRPLGTESAVYLAPNALLLSALSRAAAVFEDRRYRETAVSLYGALYPACATPRHDLSCGRADSPLFLDDAVFLAIAFLDYYKLSFDPAALSAAVRLAEDLLPAFENPDGGYFMTQTASALLPFRPAEHTDGEFPSACCCTAVLYHRLWLLTGNRSFLALRRKILSYLCGNAGVYPAGIASALTALLPELYPDTVLVCASAGEAVPPLLKAVSSGYRPDLTVLLKTPGNAPTLTEISPQTADAEPCGGKDSFYLCRDGICSGPLPG